VGRFELAHHGTLFLDEVGDLSAEAQAKLLRAIEIGEVHRVGGSRSIRVDVRIIAATNQDLARAVAAGRFREDLFFRLNVVPISVPPLRERRGDIVPLVKHFSERHVRLTGHPRVDWSADALQALRDYPWPGNVRELANIVERLAILHPGETITAAEVNAVLPGDTDMRISAGDPEAATVGALSEALDRYEKEIILNALESAAGNIAAAARRLNTDRPNLYRRMKRLGIEPSRV
jgi:two-component system, NtrC family, nitrogen regulation response regulator NtrX